MAQMNVILFRSRHSILCLLDRVKRESSFLSISRALQADRVPFPHVGLHVRENQK